MADSELVRRCGSQWIDEDDIAAVEAVLRGDWLTTGPEVTAFEAALTDCVGVQRAVVVNSGTAALHAAYFAVGLSAGDTIVTSPLTFVATANAALHLGASVRFADVDPRTGNLDPSAAEAALDPRVRAIVGVDFAGHPADAAKLSAIARRHGAHWIVDGSHSLGARRDGLAAGSLADITTTSFHPVKPITSGEGGAILTNDHVWADRAKLFRDQGIVRHGSGLELQEDPPPWYYEAQEVGLNYRLPDVLCALGRSQLTKLAGFISRRRELAERYTRELGATPGIELPFVEPGVEPGWHLYVVRVHEAKRRRDFFEALSRNGLGVQLHYHPVHLQPLYRKLGGAPGQFPNAEDFTARAVSIPMFPRLSDADASQVIETVDRVAREIL